MTCQHYWLVDPPKAQSLQVHSVCKHCGEEKKQLAWFPDFGTNAKLKRALDNGWLRQSRRAKKEDTR